MFTLPPSSGDAFDHRGAGEQRMKASEGAAKLLSASAGRLGGDAPGVHPPRHAFLWYEPADTSATAGEPCGAELRSGGPTEADEGRRMRRAAGS